MKTDIIHILTLLLLLVICAFGAGFSIGYGISPEAEVIEKEIIRYVRVEEITPPQTEKTEATEPIEETKLIETTETTPPETIAEPQMKSLGIFTATAYCCENYPHICNNGDATYTATGTTPTEGRTVAVDPNVIPYGTKVLINGHTYIAEDTGGGIKGNRIDICFSSHDRALQFGKRQVEVFIINES